MVVSSASFAGLSAGRPGIPGRLRRIALRGAHERAEPAGRGATANWRRPGDSGRGESLFAAPGALSTPMRVAAAARAFNAGNGYLCGQIIDRTI
jgi:hypothetical protein